MATKPDVELVAVTKRYGEHRRRSTRVSLRIPAGTYCCLLGPVAAAARPRRCA